MPGGDRTGPMGAGPMTGRGAGYCAGANVPGGVNNIAGRGPGAGMGRGRGLGRGVCRGLGWMGAIAAGGLLANSLWNKPSKANEKNLLRNQADQLEETLANIKQRLSQLDEAE